MRSAFVRMLVILFAFTSCSSSNRGDESNVFRYNESNGITSLDPVFARNLENMWAVNQVYDGLLALDDSMRIVPALAGAYEVSLDGLTYRFYLRRDVFFHDNECFESGRGRRVTASDVVFSFNRLRDPSLASPGAWIFDVLHNDSGCVALDDSTVQLRLKQPFPPFTGLLTTQYANIVPREAIERYGDDFRSNPVGCGPFQFAFWMEDVALVLHKNPKYYQTDELGKSLPYLDAVKISFVRDKTTEYLGLLQGRYHFMSGLHPAYKDELLKSDGSLRDLYADRIHLASRPFIKTDYIGFLVDDSIDAVRQSPLFDVRVRRALLHATDREKMVRYLRNNAVFPASGGFIPAGLPGYNASLGASSHYNPSKALELLAEAGYPKGAGMAPIVISTTSDYADLCEFLQHEWQKLGIRTEVDVMAGPVHREKVAKSQVAVFRKSWLADYPDAENFLLLFHSRNHAPGGPNYTHYRNADFDALYDEANSTVNDSLRYAIYRRLDSLVMHDVPVLPLYYDRVTHFVRNEVVDFPTNPVNMLDLSRVKLTELKQP